MATNPSPKAIKTSELIVLSACTMVLTALGIDIMLPALASVRSSFGLAADSTDTAKLISYFFLGQIFQLVFGILSDRKGRLPILRAGFVIYIFFGVVTAFSPTLEIMFFSRFLTGIGAAAVFMSTIAGVRDRFSGDQMARIMSLIFTIFLFTPVIAPFLGTAILSLTSSWKMVFLTPPLFAVLVFIWSFRLTETLPEEKRVKAKARELIKIIKGILANKTFSRYTLITSLLFTVLSTYVSTSEHIIGNLYGRPDLFAWIFGGMGLLMAFSSLSNSWLAMRFGAKKVMRVLILLYTLVAFALFLLTIIKPDYLPDLSVFVAGVAILLSLNLMIEPNTSSLALEPMGEVAGMAASLYGTLLFLIGSLVSSLLFDLLSQDILVLVSAFVIIGVLSVILAYSDKGRK